jgi:hypothetical protein
MSKVGLLDKTLILSTFDREVRKRNFHAIFENIEACADEVFGYEPPPVGILNPDRSYEWRRAVNVVMADMCYLSWRGSGAGERCAMAEEIAEFTQQDVTVVKDILIRDRDVQIPDAYGKELTAQVTKIRECLVKHGQPAARGADLK